jgi:hypothetical protein
MFQARVIAVGFVLAAGCAGQASPPAEYPPVEAPASPAAPIAPSAPAVVAEPPSPPPPPVQVVVAETTALPGPAPTLSIVTPKDGQLIKTDAVELKLALKSWDLSPDGNHVHVIVDNEPYIAVRDAQKPVDLRALVQNELGHDLTEGTHVVRVFPSRGHHESVKEAGAFDIAVFHFKKKSSDFKLDPKAPLLTYSRPKGCVQLGQRALLDFYVTNAKLSASDVQVRLSIDGQPSGDLVAWQPHYIESLPEGDHELRLTLVDAKGTALPGPFNDTTRTIRIRTDCKATTPAIPPAAPSAPAADATTTAPAQPVPAAPTKP